MSFHVVQHIAYTVITKAAAQACTESSTDCNESKICITNLWILTM